MAVKLMDLIGLIETMAPLNLKEAWDNPGLAVGDPSQMIERVLVGMDVTLELLQEAETVGAQLVLTHHPLLFQRPDSITPQTLAGRKILELVRSGRSAYSAHTNLDVAKEGMNDRLMQLLGFTDWKILSSADGVTGIGRICDVEGLTLGELSLRAARALDLSSVRTCGDPYARIRRVAVINGSGADMIQEAAAQAADCVITADTKYHEVLDAAEAGIAIIDPGHFASEWKVFQLIMQDVAQHAQQELGNVEFIISRTARDPYRTISAGVEPEMAEG